MDVILAFPQIVLVLLFVSMLGPKLWLIVAARRRSRGCRRSRGWRAASPPRSSQREYVQAAEAIGLSRRRILAREILPNVTTPLMVEFGLRLTWSIAVIAALSFLGFGIQPPNADWGLMINENRPGSRSSRGPSSRRRSASRCFAIGTNFVTEGVSRAPSPAIDRRAMTR